MDGTDGVNKVVLFVLQYLPNGICQMVYAKQYLSNGIYQTVSAKQY